MLITMNVGIVKNIRISRWVLMMCSILLVKVKIKFLLTAHSRMVGLVILLVLVALRTLKTKKTLLQ